MRAEKKNKSKKIGKIMKTRGKPWKTTEKQSANGWDLSRKRTENR